MKRWLGLVAALLIAAGTAHADERRIPLSNLLDGVERIDLQGETDQVALTAVLPPTAPLGGAVLTIRYENSVDVLPERSRLVVSFNDQAVAELPMTAFRAGPVSASISLSADRLRVGENRIVVTQEAQNRAVCTPRGTYDLWTRIHLSQSSLVLKSDRPIPAPDLAQLRVLLTASDRADQPLSILRVGQAMSRDHLGWGTMIAQAYGRALGERAPRVESGYVRDAADLRAAGAKAVLVGTRAEVGDLLPGEIAGRIAGPFLAVLPSGTVPGGFLLVVSGRTPEEVDTAALRLADLDHTTLPAEAATVIDKAPVIPAAADVRAEGRVTLGALGFRTVNHLGYRYQDSVHLRLPADFRAVADRAVIARIDGGFEGEYGPGTLLNVRVNDQAAGTIEVDRRSTPKLERAELRLPMRLFRAGDNRVTFEAVLNPVSETECLRSTRRPGFTLRDSTELEIPGFARAVDLPDLGISTRTGFPYLRPAEPQRKGAFDLIVVGEDEQWRSIAMTLAARLSQGAEAPLRPVPVLGWHDPGARDALIVGPVNQLPNGALAATGVPPGWLTAVLEAGARMSVAEAGGTGLPEVDRRRMIQTLIGDALPAKRGMGTANAGETSGDTRWEAPAGTNSGTDGLMVKARRAIDWLLARLGESELTGPAARTGDTIAGLGADGRLPDTALVQFEGLPGAHSTWTVLTGADAANAARATWALTAAPRWSKVSGATVLWRADGGEALTLPASGTYAVISDPANLGNLFLIAATFLSQRIGLLFGLLLVLVTVLAMSLHFLLRAGRTKD